MNKKVKKVFCPTCGKEIIFSVDNTYRPFCSEKCKLIDLGQWAEEKYKVPCQDDDSEKISFDEN